MSDLQIVLIVIGGLIIAIVLVFNWWQERKFHQQVEKNFSTFNPDIDNSEPSISGEDLRLDVDKFDDEDFTINTHSFNDASHGQVSTDQEPGIAQDFEDTLINTSDAHVLPVAESSFIEPSHAVQYEEPRTARHDDIKAIIEGAFKNDVPSKVPMHDDTEQTSDVAESLSETAQAAKTSLPTILHSQVDLVALLYLQGAATVKDVINVLKDGFDGYDKPSFVHVQTEMRWLLLNDVASKDEYANLAVSKICCAIQLADRAGPILRSILNRFQLAVESLGLDMNAQVEWQSTSDALNDANALDQFCIEVDKTMGFHLLHGENGAFTGTKLRGLAESQGLELGSDGSFKYYDASAKSDAISSAAPPMPSFVMFNRDHNPFSVEMLRSSVVKSITFQLDIPHVKNAIDAFNQMVLVAKQMETGLHAQLVDDNNRPLGDAQIEKIRHQLKIIQATMLTRGITPGSDCAHRLFS